MAKADDPNVHIRWLIRRDMPEVLSIENAVYEFPWSEEEFINFLRQRSCLGMVAELDERVVGFMLYELHRKRLQIVKFAVDPEHQRMSIGTQMADKLIGKLSIQRRKRLGLTVRESNLAAQMFFKAMRFQAVSIIKNHSAECRGDAYVMEYSIEPISRLIK